MGASTKIEWTDHTFNPWRSCQHLILADGSTHPACEHCYAEAMAKRFPERLGQWGAEGTRIMAPEKLWRQPLAWNKAAEKTGQRARVFCASIADVFEDWQGEIWNDRGERVFDVPAGSYLTMDDLRKKLFALIDQTPWLDWQLLTKRPGNILKMWQPIAVPPGCSRNCDAGLAKRSNVWLGTSIRNQQTADELIPQLLQARELAAQLFLSAEPLLGPVDLFGERIYCRHHKKYETAEDLRERSPCFRGQAYVRDMFDWVICGGESGQQARPMHPAWTRSLRDQCQAAGVAFFFKQWGEWTQGEVVPGGDLGGDFRRGKAEICHLQSHTSEELCRRSFFRGDVIMRRVGKKEAGRLLDGREWNEFPGMNHKGSKAPSREEESV